METKGYLIHHHPTVVRTRNHNHFYIEAGDQHWEFVGEDAYDQALAVLFDEIGDMSAYYEVLSGWGECYADQAIGCVCGAEEVA